MAQYLGRTAFLNVLITWQYTRSHNKYYKAKMLRKRIKILKMWAVLIESHIPSEKMYKSLSAICLLCNFVICFGLWGRQINCEQLYLQLTLTSNLLVIKSDFKHVSLIFSAMTDSLRNFWHWLAYSFVPFTFSITALLVGSTEKVIERALKDYSGATA